MSHEHMCSEFLNEFCNNTDNKFSDLEDDTESSDQELMTVNRQPQNDDAHNNKVTIIIDSNIKKSEIESDKQNEFCHEYEWKHRVRRIGRNY